MVSNMKNIFDSSGFRDIYNNIKNIGTKFGRK